MRISFWIPAIVFYYVVKIVSLNCIQVGTVLFTTTDIVKKCWSESDKALLRARYILQDLIYYSETLLFSSVFYDPMCFFANNNTESFTIIYVLPDPDCIDFSKPDAVVTLLDYFKSCYDVISLSTYGKIQNLMLLALSDALGGYLRSYALPLTKKAYYTGQVKYSDAKKLFRLYDDIRCFLKTNGFGWAKPQKLIKNKFNAKPLVFGNTEDKSSCNQLYTIVRKSENKNSRIVDLKSECQKDEVPKKKFRIFHSKNLNEKKGTKKTKNLNTDRFNEEVQRINDDFFLKQNFKKEKRKNDAVKKRKVDDLKNNNNITMRYKKNADWENFKIKPEAPKEASNKMVIPLPVLEDCRTLHTIAIPFKTKPLRNIQDRESAFILERYYITVIKCLMSKSSASKDIKSFNSVFYSWMNVHVFPHLEDEQWYPAFGGIYRIIATIKKLGSEPPIGEVASHDIRYIFWKGFEFENDNKKSKPLGKDKVRDVGENYEFSENKPNYFLAGILILLAIWSCIFCLSIYYCLVNKKKKRTCAPKKVEKKKPDNLNFQFLIKFFKNQEPEPNDDLRLNSVDELSLLSDKGFFDFGSNSLTSVRNVFTSYTNTKDKNVFKKEKYKELFSNKKKLEKDGGQGDFPSVISCNADPPKANTSSVLAPVWKFHNSFNKSKKVKSPEKTESKKSKFFFGLSSSKEGKNELKTLWMKPSNKTKRKKNNIENEREKLQDRRSGEPNVKRLDSDLKKDKKKLEGSIQKRFSLFRHGESANSCITSTNTSSQSQIQEVNSETIKFLQRAMNNCKDFKRLSTEKSTEESDSEKDASYSSDTDTTDTTYEEVSVNKSRK